jgi:hypothetical protein
MMVPSPVTIANTSALPRHNVHRTRQARAAPPWQLFSFAADDNLPQGD